MVGNSNQILVDLVVHLFEIEHYQVGYFQQFINHRIVTTNKTVGVQTGMNPAFLCPCKELRQKINLEREKIKELVTDISHQTKTPLTNIELYTQLLQEQNLDETSKFLADEIQKQALKLEFLIQSLIKTSRLETGTLQFNPKSNSINNLIAKAVDQAEKKALKKNITVICGKESTTAIFDLKWTVEALFNIIDNAVKYTNENGTITISVKSYELFACISIQDNGIGIAEEEQEKIFGRFNRGSNVSETEGTGIGLYLSREIIEKQGGYIHLQSKLGEGSIFEIYLPK